MEWHTTEVTDP